MNGLRTAVAHFRFTPKSRHQSDIGQCPLVPRRDIQAPPIRAEKMIDLLPITEDNQKTAKNPARLSLRATRTQLNGRMGENGSDPRYFAVVLAFVKG